MKKELTLLTLAGFFLSACAVQKQSHDKNSMKFDFGTDNAASGYTAVWREWENEKPDGN